MILISAYYTHEQDQSIWSYSALMRKFSYKELSGYEAVVESVKDFAREGSYDLKNRNVELDEKGLWYCMADYMDSIVQDSIIGFETHGACPYIAKYDKDVIVVDIEEILEKLHD